MSVKFELADFLEHLLDATSLNDVHDLIVNNSDFLELAILELKEESGKSN